VAKCEVVGIYVVPVNAVKLDWRVSCLVVSGTGGVVGLREVAGIKGG
jgi:hypothetical protein